MSKKTVYNRNFQKPTRDNMKLVIGNSSLDTDYRFCLDVESGSIKAPQITFHAHLVPPLENQSGESPFIVATVPPIETFLGVVTPFIFVVEFNEAVLNATDVSNYVVAGEAVGEMVVDSVSELTPSGSGGTRVEVILEGKPAPDGFLTMTVGGSSAHPITDDTGNTMAVEVLEWYLDHTRPTLQSSSPADGDALDHDTYDWAIGLDFTEDLLDGVNGWRDPSHYEAKLISFSDGFEPFPLTVLGVIPKTSSRPYQYGNDAGQLGIKVIYEDPTSALGSGLYAYEELVLNITGVDGLVDRANNQMRDVSSIVFQLKTDNITA